MSNGTSQLDVWNRFIIDGDLDALGQIYFQYYDLLFDYGQRHISEKHLVEDVIQDIFVNLIKTRKNIGIVRNLNGYLFSTFRRQLFLDYNKQKKTFLTEKFSEEHFEYYKSTELDISENKNTEKIYIY